MSNTLQNYLAAATEKAAKDLIETIEALPEAQRAWSPSDKGRSALDQAAECAMLNGVTAKVIVEKVFPTGFDFGSYQAEKAKLAADWETLKPLLVANTAQAADAIRATGEDALDVPVTMPWGVMTVGEILVYPFWNMTYHQGQSYYIGSIA